MANDKKFIVKNGLLTPENAVIGSNTDTGEKLQVTGDTVLTQSTAGTPTLKVTNSGGNSAIIGQFEGDAESLQVKNLTTGDYQLVNTGQNNGIIFYNDTGGVSIQYNGGDRLVLSNTGNEFTGLSNTTIDGNRILTTADEGAGNGLDADTVDGLEAAQFVRADVDDIMAGNYTIQNDLTIQGDLTVSGNTTTVNTEEILLADNIITINSNYTGSTPTEDGGIEVERGTLSNAKVIWNESSDYWQLEVNGSVLGRIITTADEGSGNGFDADTVDGLEAAQFLRSDADDTATGNITIEGDLTLGDNTGPAQIFFDGSGVNRTLYSASGEIGFLNTSANWAMKSDADGDLEVERDVEAGRDVTADRNIVAEDDITSTTGDITASAGDIEATLGNVEAGTDVRAGQDVDADRNVIASVDLRADTGNITALQGNIVATLGNVAALSGDVQGERFIDVDDPTYYLNPHSISHLNTIDVDGQIRHHLDTNTLIDFNTDQIKIQTGGADRLDINNTRVLAGVDVYAPNLFVNDAIIHNNDVDTKIVFATDDISLQTGGAERLGIDNDGVDITGDLDVTGDGDFGGDISGGDGTFTGDVTGAKFIDADDNTYYADPNATSVMNTIGIDDYIFHNGDTDTKFGFNAADNFQLFTANVQRLEINGTYLTSAVDGIFPNLYAGRYYDSSNATYYGDFASTSRVNDISLVGEIIHDGDTDTYIHFPAANQFAVVTGGAERLRVENGYVFANNQMRSPIYYDSDNTAYYGNFAGDSQMQEVHIDDWIRHRGDTNTYIGFPAADTIEMTTGGGIRATITNTNATFNSDVLADRFVDRQSTGYYLNPADATLSATLNGSVRIANIANSTRYSDSSGTGGIVLAGHQDIATNQSTTLAISGQYSSGAYSLMYLNRIDANINPFNPGNRYIEFRADGGGTTPAAFRGDSSGNFYLTPQNSQNIGFWTSGGNEVAVALDDGNFIVGGSSVSYTINDNTPLIGSNTNNKLHVNGSIQLTSNDDAIVFGRGTSTFLKDEELGFGWGSGLYMLDATYLRVRNNKTLYSTGVADFNQFRSYQNTAYYVDPDGDSQLNTVDIDDYVRHRGDTNTLLGFSGNDSILFQTNGANRASINNSRMRVRSKLEVWGSGIELQKQSNAGGVGITMTDQGSTETPGLSGLQQVSIKAWHADNAYTTGANMAMAFESSEPTTHYVFGTNANAAGGNVIPRVTNTGSLGLTSYRWSAIYAQQGNFSGDVTGNNAYFARYYDSNDNTYYADPNGTSIFRGLQLNNPAGDTVLQFGPGLPSNDDAHIEWKGTNNAGYLRFSTADDSDAGSNEHMEFGDYAGTGRTGAFFRWARMQRAYFQHDSSVRSPIFYASDNTAYYVDPNGDSQLNTIDIDDYIRHRGDTNTYFGFEANDTFRVWTNGTQRLNIDNNSADFSINVYAPRYYDSNDASFYTDPAATSLQRRLNLYSGESTGEFNVGRGSTQRFNMYVTDTVGYIRYYQDETGGQDHSVSFEIQSGSSGANEFRFNRPLNVNGSGSAGYIYARRFVDRDNTSYFVDPASNSFMATIELQQNPVGTAYYGVAAQPTYYFGQQRGDNDGWKIYGESPSGTNTGNLILQSEDDYDSNESIRMRFKRTYGAYDTNDVLQAYYNYVLSPSSFRAPIFYDSNNTSYYGDFNGRSILYQASVANQLTAGATSGYVTNAVLDVAGAAVMRGTNNLYFGVTTTNYNSWQSRIYNRTSSTMAFDAQEFEWGNVGYSSGAARMFFDASEGRLQVTGDMRAPIFYDRNNTGYYVDPASNSRFNTTQALRYYMNHGTSYWIDEAGGNYGSIQTGGRRNGWAGYSIENNWVFMGETNEVGLYNDIDNKWILQSYRNQWLRLMYNGTTQAQTASGYFLANNQMRAPIYYDSSNTAYYLDPASGNTSNALKVAGRIRRDNFQTSGNGDNNRFLEAQDYSHWIWNTANNWGIFWAGNNGAAYQHFGSSNPNELVFVGSGNTRASIDLDNGNAYFQGEVSASNYNLNGGNENISLNPTYSRGALDETIFDGSKYFEKRVIKNMQGAENYTTPTTSEFVKSADAPGASSYVLRTSAYRNFYSDYIEVEPGEELFGEIHQKTISGSGGRLYYGIERFDKDKRPIAGNTGTTYFVVGGSIPTQTSWQTYRNHVTMPTSHSPYSGSDGGGVRYVRLRVLYNYPSGGALREFTAPVLRRTNHHGHVRTNYDVEGSVFRDTNNSAYYLDMDSVSYLNDIRPNILYDRNDTNYYLDPNGTTRLNRLIINARGDNTNVGSINTTNQQSDWQNLQISNGQFTVTQYNAINNYSNSPTGVYTYGSVLSTKTANMGWQLYFAHTGDLAYKTQWNNDQYSGWLTPVVYGRNSGSASGKSVYGNIYYDSDDTNYYVNPNSDSVMHNVNVRNYGVRLQRNYTHNGIWFNGGTDQNHVLWNHYYGGPAGRGGANSGGFDGIKWNTYAGIHFRGGSNGAYNLARFATTGGGNTNSHYVQLYANNVEQLGTRGSYGYAPNQMRSPIYYDTNTAYFGNFDGESSLNTLRTAGRVVIGGNFGNNAYNSVGSTRLHFGGGNSDANGNYYIGTNLDNYNGNYTKLDLRWHTGIRMGAQAVYGGTRIYNNEDLSTLLFSVGRSDTHVRVESGSNLYVTSGDARATIFYDINDTAYYANPNGTSRFYEQRNVWRLHLGDESNLYNAVLQETRRPDLTVKGQYPQINIMSSEINNGTHGPTLRFVGYDGANASSGNFKHWVIGTSATNATRLSFGYSPNQTNPHYGIGRGWSSGNNVAMFWLENNRNVYAENNIYANQFISRQNTGYYIDPDGTTRLNTLYTNRLYPCYDNNTGMYMDYPTGSYGSIQVNGGGKSGWEGYSINGRYVFMSADNNQVGIYNDVDNEWMLYAERNSHLYLYHNGQWEARTDNGYFRMERSGRAPIFYDLNDTGYYVNPNGQSHMNTLTLQGNRLGFVNSAFDAEIRVSDSNPDGTGATFVFYGDQVAYNAEVATEVFRGTRHMRAPRYYDLNSSSYYGDFASTSYMNDVRANIFYERENTAYYFGSSQGDARMRNVRFNEVRVENGATIQSVNGGGRIYMGGNFHIDAQGGNDLYLNYYSGRRTRMYAPGQVEAARLDTNRIFYAFYDLRAPIMYDYNDTGYYVNPNSTSQLRAVYANDWFRPQGGSGLYFQDYGYGLRSAHSEGNPYGNVSTYNIGRNGWGGYGIGSRWTWMSTEGNNVGVHDNTRGWLQYYNGSYTDFNYGYVQSDSSFRAPIFYDLNDTGYYMNPNGDSNWQGLTARGQAMIGLPGVDRSGMRNNYGRRPNITGNDNYWTGSRGWGRVDMNTVGNWGSGFFDSWSNPPNQPSGTSHWVGVQAYHYTNGSARYGWQLAGGPITNLRFRSTWSGFRSWRTVPVLDENSTNGGAMYAGIYYDSNNTGYYCNPYGRSRLQQIDFGNGSYYIRAGSWGMRNQTPYGYIEFGPANTSHAHIYTDRTNFYFNRLIQVNGRSRMDTNDIRSDIFYDLNNTGYYTNPASTSRMNNITVNRINSPYAGGNSGITRSSSPYSYGFQESGGWSYPYPDMVFQFHTGLSFAANPSYQGMRFFNDYNSNTVRFQINGSSSYTYANTWLRVAGANQGIYSSHNGAHWEPNAQTGYGSWNIRGSRSGYRGISFHDAGYDPHIMWDGSGNGGFYHEDLGRWLLYHNRGNNCMGVGSSSTRSGYRMQVNGSLWCTGNIVAYSDERRKENIETIENGLEKVLQLRGVTYTRKLESWEEEKDNSFQGTQMGLIAQEVMEIVPEVVTHDVEDDEYGIDYPKMVGLLVEAHKDQQKLINSQQEKIDKLEEMLYNIMNKMENK